MMSIYRNAQVSTAVDRILDDLTDRRGLGQAWDEIDKDIQEELREKWKRIIHQELDQ